MGTFRLGCTLPVLLLLLHEHNPEHLTIPETSISVLSPNLCTHLAMDPSHATSFPPAATSQTRVSTLCPLLPWNEEEERDISHLPRMPELVGCIQKGPAIGQSCYTPCPRSTPFLWGPYPKTGWRQAWPSWSNSKQLWKVILFPEPNFLCVAVWDLEKHNLWESLAWKMFIKTCPWDQNLWKERWRQNEKTLVVPGYRYYVCMCLEIEKFLLKD